MAELAHNVYHPSLMPSLTNFHSAPPCAWGLVTASGFANFIFQGTEIAALRDLLADTASMVPWRHPKLGVICAGFWVGMDGVAETVARLAGSLPIHITGHSLGAAHAVYCAAELVAAGVPVNSLVVFGCPHLCLSPDIPNLLAKIPFVTSFRNQVGYVGDPVTHLPPDFLPAGEYTLIDVGPTTPLDWLQPFTLHDSAKYAAGCPETVIP
jgi:hypothetical protein